MDNIGKRVPVRDCLCCVAYGRSEGDCLNYRNTGRPLPWSAAPCPRRSPDRTSGEDQLQKKANKQAHATFISLCSVCVCDETSLFKFLPWFPTVVVCGWNKPISPLKWFLSWYLITATEMKLRQWSSHLGIQAGKCIRNPPMLLRPGQLTHTNSGMGVSVGVRLCQGGRDVKIPVWTQ